MQSAVPSPPAPCPERSEVPMHLIGNRHPSRPAGPIRIVLQRQEADDLREPTGKRRWSVWGPFYKHGAPMELGDGIDSQCARQPRRHPFTPTKALRPVRKKLGAAEEPNPAPALISLDFEF
jgi:hypothetical protein